MKHNSVTGRAFDNRPDFPLVAKYLPDSGSIAFGASFEFRAGDMKDTTIAGTIMANNLHPLFSVNPPRGNLNELLSRRHIFLMMFVVAFMTQRSDVSQRVITAGTNRSAMTWIGRPRSPAPFTDALVPCPLPDSGIDDSHTGLWLGKLLVVAVAPSPLSPSPQIVFARSYFLLSITSAPTKSASSGSPISSSNP